MDHFGRIAFKLRSFAPHLIVAMIACWAFAVLCAGRSEAHLRTPLGVYAHVDVPSFIAADITGPNANPALKGVTIGKCSALPSSAVSTVHGDLQKLYASLLRKTTNGSSQTDPVSGIELGVPWCLIQPCKPGDSQCTPCESGSSQCNLAKGEDWQWISDVFEAIGSDSTLSAKTVQLNIAPGFDSPQWLVNDINKLMGSCDGYFDGSNKNPSYNCGTVTFTNFPECTHVASQVLPLPWNKLYSLKWSAFLTDLWTWLQTVPNETALVSISVAGPSGASAEFILPSAGNKSYVLWKNGVATLGCSTAGGGTDADTMWTTLITKAQQGPHGENALVNSPAADYPNSNPSMYLQFPPQVFVDYWNNAIDMYEGIFSDITLVLTPDAGSDFPEIGSPSLFPIQAGTNIVGVHDKTANVLWGVDCSKAGTATSTSYTVSCGSKVEILSHFITAPTGKNAKSTYVGGMTSSTCINTGFIDLPGVKVLTSWSSLSSLRRQTFTGGAQFDHSVSQSPADRCQEGCPPGVSDTTSPTCATGTATIYNTCSPDQAAYNALTDFFNATEGQVYFRGTLSIPEGCTGKPLKNQPAPIQYVNVNYNDIQYAKEEVCPTQAPAIPGTCTTMLDLLNQTQYYLSGAMGTARSPSCPYTAPPCAPSCQIAYNKYCGAACNVTCRLGQNAVCTGGGFTCDAGEPCSCNAPPKCVCQ